MSSPKRRHRKSRSPLTMFQSKGWRWIDAEEAFTDSVFSAKPKIVPAGDSIIWALAKESGKIPRGLRYPAEDGEYEMARIKKRWTVNGRVLRVSLVD